MTDADVEPTSIIGELRQLRSLVEETETSLRSQREILKMRNMSLPPMVMQSISSLDKDLGRLEASMVNEQTELAQLRALADNAALINSSLDVDTVLNQSMDVVISLTGAERGFIILKNPDTGEMEFRVAREDELQPKQGRASGNQPQISHTIINEVIETGEPLLADNAYKDERLQSGLSIAAFALRSVLCVPLKYKDDVVGVVYVDNRLRAGVFEEREKHLLSAFANQAAVAIENARLYENIQQSLREIGEMKELMDNVFASIGSGVITADTEHKIMTFNRAAAQILDRSPEEVQGQHLGAVLDGINVDLDTQLALVRQKAAIQALEAEMDVPSRGRVALNMKISPLRDSHQEIDGVAMVMDDLTEQHEREEILTVIKKYLPPEMVDMIHAIAQMDLGGERREVTCMYVDVRPVTTFPADLRPQQIMEELNIYFARATDCIHHVKGIVDKYMGTEIMVLFNSQLNPMEDHSLRAIEAALAIRDSFVTLYEELGIDPNPHYYRIGIHTGVATLGNVGSLNRREFSAIGNTINQSKRLEESTQEGQIIVSTETLVHLEETLGSFPSHIRIEERDPVRLKGITEPVPIFEVFKS